MSILRRCLPFVLVVINGIVFAQSQSSEQNQSLGEIARALRAKKEAASGAAPAPVATPPEPVNSKPAQAESEVLTNPPEIDAYMQAVLFQKYRKDYAQLDKMADEARSTKARFPGGGWKLYTFYVQLGLMDADATDADWQEHLAFFEKWIAARPQSITARVALASAYSDYAWVARGSGYADQVTPEGARLFQERIAKAAKILIDASRLEAKCPQWYMEFEIVGRAQGLEKPELRRIFDKAVAFEPDYYYVYQQQAIGLLPQWEGDDGDTEKFVDESYRRAGGQKGAMLYFQIASVLCQECGEFHPQGYSWPVLKEGFATLEKSYGLTPLWLNKFARMAVLYEDKPAAAKAFVRIGNNWDQSVWGSREQFDSQRAWAGLTPVIPAKQKPAFVLDAQSTQQLTRLLGEATQAASEGRFDESSKTLRRVIENAKPFPGTEYWLQKAYVMLAANEQRQGHMEQARSIMDEEIEFVSSRNGAESSEVATALDARAMLEQKMNDDKRAEADLRRAIAIRQKASTPAMQLPIEVYSLAMIMRRQSRYKEALEFLQPFIPAEVNADPHKESSIAWLLQVQGMCYQELGQYKEAEAAYVRMMRILDVTLPVNSVGFTDLLSKMASLYHAMGKEADAQKVEQRLKEIQMQQQGK